jgi:phosphonate transport system substrate-binding protein
MLVLSSLVFALAGCGGEAELGTEENPLIWSFVPSGEMQDVVAGAEGVIALIEEETGFAIDANVATEYAGVIEAMCSDPVEAHMGSLATFAYVLAAKRGCAEAALVSVRFGSPTYNGQIIVRADSGITELSQLAGKTFCRPDPLSTSGWIIPSLDLAAAGVDPETGMAEVVDAGSHDAAVTAVYNGDCDAAAVYVDARSGIEDEFPDVKEVIDVIHVSVDIPNDGLQFTSAVPQEMRDQIVNAMVRIMETEEGQEAMDAAYEWAGVEVHGDEFYDPFRQLLDAAGVDIEELQE